MEDTLQTLDDLISQFLSLDRPLWSSSDDADAFLEAVDELTSTIRGLENTSEDHVLLESFDLLLERCSMRLKDEFQRLIATSGFDDNHGGHNIKKSRDEDDSHTFVAPPIRDFDIIVDALPDGVATQANRIARRMIDVVLVIFVRRPMLLRAATSSMRALLALVFMLTLQKGSSQHHGRSLRLRSCAGYLQSVLCSAS